MEFEGSHGLNESLYKTPFPWFGGKADAAEAVWEALGDVAHYVEPFAGGLAVLLRRPHEPNRTYFSETVGDTDALLTNFWRSVQLHPQETAEAASWPVSELDKHARGCFLLRWRESEATAHLAGDPLFCEPLVAGWWAWTVCCNIGGWGLGGPWWPDADGFLRKRPRGSVVTGAEPGVSANRPHLSNDGRGVNRPQAREPGVSADLPHLGGNGQGVNHAGTREPGLTADLPHLGNDGRGVNHAGTREPGVWADRPHLTGDGQGVNHAGTREPGVSADLPHLGDDGRGVNRPQAREPGLTWQQHVQADYADSAGYHPITMPEIRRWFAWLSARLRHVRIVNADWSHAVNGDFKRLLTSGAAETLPVRQSKGVCGVFLDPPYGDVGRQELYGKQESLTVAAEVRQWCLKTGANPKYRIVYAGYDVEGSELISSGWREIEWFRAGHLRGGMGNIAKRLEDDDGPMHQQHRERLWLSPHCLQRDEERMLF